MKIYVPSDTTYNKCYVVYSEDIIRVYDKVPSNNTTYNYRDYYIHSDYIYKDGSGSWSSYSTLPTCLSSDTITNDFYYRVDFTNILINFLVISIIGVYLPICIFMRLFKKGGVL